MARETIRDLLDDPRLDGSYFQELCRGGYLVFENVLPPALVKDCLAAYQDCALIARRLYGPRAQRLQPLGNPDFQLNLAPLEQVRAKLQMTMQIAFRSPCTYAMPETIGVLVEPELLLDGSALSKKWGPDAYIMPLHRDWLYQKPHADLEHLLVHWDDPLCFWQFNLPLRKDDSFFLVPGSHLNLDLAVEARVAKKPLNVTASTETRLSSLDTDFTTGPLTDRMRPRYLPEQGSSEFARGFVKAYWQGAMDRCGAVQIALQPGDLLIYRATMLHGAQNFSDRERLTFHDFCMTPEFAQVIQHQQSAWKKGEANNSPSWMDIPGALFPYLFSKVKEDFGKPEDTLS